MMTGLVAGDTALRWSVYLLASAFVAWIVTVVVLAASALGRRVCRYARAWRSRSFVP